VDVGRHDVGQQGVAGRDAQPAGRPGPGAQHRDLSDGRGGADQAGEDGRGRVAAHGLGATALGVVGDGPAGQASRAGRPVGDALVVSVMAREAWSQQLVASDAATAATALAVRSALPIAFDSGCG